MPTERPPIRVLLVDDDEDDFLLTRDRLRDAGRGLFVLDHVSNAREGFAAIARGDHDVVLLDYRLGAENGLEMLERAVAEGCDRPIILLTGQDDDELARRAVRSGAADYLVKEKIETDALVRSIRYSIERKALENDLRVSNSGLEARVAERTGDLERAVGELEGFTYTVAHDLRAPLRAINATARILLEDYGGTLPREATAMLERQASAAARLGRLIDDLLTLSRIDRAEPERRTVDLTRLFEIALAEARKEHPRIEVWADVEPRMLAVGDVRLLGLAVGNLVENAVKFARDDRADLTAFAETSREGTWVTLADRGRGFDPAEAHRLFRPFERLVSEDVVPGTGIGLANVRRVIERHGGRIEARGELGVGATFRFFLPANAP